MHSDADPVLPPESPGESAGTPPRRRRSRRVIHYCVSAPTACLGMYLVAAYLVMPMAWRGWSRLHPALDDAPRVTHTANGIHGDPLNLALIGSDAALTDAMAAAGWRPADPITLRTSLRLTRATLLRHPYEEAPVSNLFVWGRKQDFAFQHPSGTNPRQRHHVRFWCAPALDESGRLLWFGAATFDTSVGLSHTTAQVTHHIDADVDSERDKLLADISAAGFIDELQWVDDFHAAHNGRNGGGDPYRTDGRLPVAVLVAGAR